MNVTVYRLMIIIFNMSHINKKCFIFAIYIF